MKLNNILNESITIDELERIVRKVYIDEIKKQIKKMRMNNDKIHHIFFVATRGKTLSDNINNEIIKSLNSTIKKKPDVLDRMDSKKAEKEIRNQVAYKTIQYLMSASK